MENYQFKPSELILNDDGSIYHIHLRPEHIAPTVILVGDQGRVARISKYFDHIEHEILNREFMTHTGTYKGTRLTVMSTGIGTDNIDIAVNELDAAVNIDLVNRQLKSERKSLNLIRIGTSGALHTDIPVGSYVISRHGLGFDGLMHYYNYKFSPEEKMLGEKIDGHLEWNPLLSRPYVVEGSADLFEKIGEDMIPGITATASGFYGPQGRRLYLEPANKEIPQRFTSFHFEGHRITNFEMETSALYGLGKMMGHHCCTCCAIIANRTIGEYSEDYKAVVDGLIKTVLDRIVGENSL